MDQCYLFPTSRASHGRVLSWYSMELTSWFDLFHGVEVSGTLVGALAQIVHKGAGVLYARGANAALGQMDAVGLLMGSCEGSFSRI